MFYHDLSWFILNQASTTFKKDWSEPSKVFNSPVLTTWSHSLVSTVNCLNKPYCIGYTRVHYALLWASSTSGEGTWTSTKKYKKGIRINWIHMDVSKTYKFALCLLLRCFIDGPSTCTFWRRGQTSVLHEWYYTMVMFQMGAYNMAIKHIKYPKDASYDCCKKTNIQHTFNIYIYTIIQVGSGAASINMPPWKSMTKKN